MKNMRWILISASLALACLQSHSSLADDKKAKEPEKKKAAPVPDIVVNGELINVDLKDRVLTQCYCKTFTFKMEKGKTYQIDLASDVFQPYLRLEDAAGTQIGAAFGQPARLFHAATKTEDHQIVVTSQNAGIGKFALTVRDATASSIFTVTEKLNQNDQAYKGKKHKLFTVELEAGKTYQIDMRSGNFDSYLFFEGPDGKLLAQDDDGGGYPSARIVHKTAAAGKHRIIATHFGGGGNLGEFTVTVRQTDGAPVRDDQKVQK